jgi:translation initiation factor IF-3
MKTEKARERAEKKGLDLVEVSPASNPPVCKIMDYGNYLYDIKKKKKAQKKAQKKTDTKTIRLSIRTESHDLETKAKQARKFAEKGHPLKIVVIFKGREITHKDLGVEKMHEFQKLLEDITTIEQEPKKQGYQMIMTLNPIKS